MGPNPFLKELQEAREELLAKAGNDFHRYVEEARKRLLDSGRKIVELDNQMVPEEPLK